MTATRIKISISLPRDLVAAVDQEAKRSASSNRSAVIEAWLRNGARRREEQRLEDDVIAYYRSLDDAAIDEDHAISKRSTKRR